MRRCSQPALAISRASSARYAAAPAPNRRREASVSRCLARRRCRASAVRRQSADSPNVDSRQRAARPAEAPRHRCSDDRGEPAAEPTLATHELAMPTKRRPRRHHQTNATRPRQTPRQSGKQRAISRTQPRTRMLPAQHDDLMAQHEQLNILRKIRTPTTSDQPQQRHEHVIDERKQHRPILQKPRPQQLFEPLSVLLEPFTRCVASTRHVPATYPRVARAGDNKCLFAGISVKPPDGLEPSTPSLPCAVKRLPWVATGCGSACLSGFRRCPICHRLPPVAPAGLHKCSIHLPRIADGQRDSGVVCPASVRRSDGAQ